MKRKILVVDDERQFTQMLKLNLEQTGKFSVQTENQATRALETARSFKPDLILLDFLMLDMVGSEVARRLKIDQETKKIPIVFLTATLSEGETEPNTGVVNGYHYITKPADSDTIAKYIEEALDI